MEFLEIHYADDDSDDVDFFMEAIKSVEKKSRIPIKCTIHNGGENVIHDMKENAGPHSILFLDINMPGKDGFQILESLRKDELYSDLFIVMLSTSSESNAIKKCKDLGANFYAIKPTTIKTLERIIEKVVTLNSGEYRKIFTPFVIED